jgi:ABC-type multidrug transport system ATPase subunit
VYEGGELALAGVNLVIGNGVFGLLGRNASGKTTLIRILATLLKPSGGMVTIDGLDLAGNRSAIRSMTGYLPQRFGSFTRMTTGEFLDYTARLAGLRDRNVREREVDSLLESLGLESERKTFANELPVVMKRHLEIAQAVIGNPRILLVDEPTAGLSPEERTRFGNLLAERSRAIEIIIMTTHILDDISGAWNGMAILDRGEIAYHGAPDIGTARSLLAV